MGSETELGELSSEWLNGLVLGSVGLSGLLSLLDLVASLRLDLSLLLKSVDEVSVGPAGLGSEISKSAELAMSLQTEGAESVRDDHALLLVVGEGNTLEDLELAKSGGTLGELVREHTTGALPENARRSSPMLGTTAGVGVDALLHNVLSNDLVSLERARLKNGFTADDCDTLAREKLLGNDAGETAFKMASSVND